MLCQVMQVGPLPTEQQFKSHQKRRHCCTECRTMTGESEVGELSLPALFKSRYEILQKGLQ